MSPSTISNAPAPLASPYLDAITWHHKQLTFFLNRHNHLQSKAWLNNPIFRIPKPPASTGKHTLSQATDGYLNSSSDDIP